MSTLCQECFDQYTEQAELLVDILHSEGKADVKELASDILYGLLLTMYEVDDEEEEDEEEEQPDVRMHQGDGYTVTVTNLGDLLASTISTYTT